MVRMNGARGHRKAVCNLCGKRLRPDRMKKHLARAHPDGLVSERDHARAMAWRMGRRRKAAVRITKYVVPVVIIIICTAYMIAVRDQPVRPATAVGTMAPEVVIEDIQGIVHNFSKDHYGKDCVLVEFFLTTCHNCKNMETSLLWLYANYSQCMRFYSVSSDGLDEVREWQESHEARWPHCCDPMDTTYRMFQPSGDLYVPHFYFIDRDGVIRHDVLGDISTTQDGHDDQAAYEELESYTKDIIG